MTTHKVDSLLQALEQMQPMFHSLGTPVLAENDEALSQLVRMGTKIVPYLVGRIQGDAPKKTAAYAAMVLGRLGDARGVEPLRNLRATFQARQSKDEWDYAVIGQCDLALSRLEKPSP
jgi:HEAT repeat protein